MSILPAKISSQNIQRPPHDAPPEKPAIANKPASKASAEGPSGSFDATVGAGSLAKGSCDATVDAVRSCDATVGAVGSPDAGSGSTGALGSGPVDAVGSGATVGALGSSTVGAWKPRSFRQKKHQNRTS